MPKVPRWHRSIFVRAANTTYLRPFLGLGRGEHLLSSQVCEEMPRLQALWRSQLVQLLDAGLSFNKRSLECEPRYLDGDRRKLWYCEQLLCPYCHGRVVLRLLRRLRQAEAADRHCLVFSQSKYATIPGLRTMSPAALRPSLVALRKLVQSQSLIRADHLQAKARAVSLQFELDCHGRREGVWLRTSELYVTAQPPSLLLFPKHSGTLRVTLPLTGQSRGRLSRVVGLGFPFPVSQATADPALVLILLQALRNQKRFITGGFLKGISSE